VSLSGARRIRKPELESAATEAPPLRKRRRSAVIGGEPLSKHSSGTLRGRSSAAPQSPTSAVGSSGRHRSGQKRTRRDRMTCAPARLAPLAEANPGTDADLVRGRPYVTPLRVNRPRSFGIGGRCHRSAALNRAHAPRAMSLAPQSEEAYIRIDANVRGRNAGASFTGVLLCQVSSGIASCLAVRRIPGRAGRTYTESLGRDSSEHPASPNFSKVHGPQDSYLITRSRSPRFAAGKV
jgi:hypothetical protein